MKLPAIVTAASPRQRHILYQALETPGQRKLTIGASLIRMLEGVCDRIALVVPAGDAVRVREAFGSPQLTIIEQAQPQGYAHALYQAREFTGGQPFLHLVGDHFYLADQGEASSLAEILVDLFQSQGASISAVQPTREAQLPYFGTVGGPSLSAAPIPLYRVETVLEKPTPTEAEREIAVSGLRQGHYLCFFGMHVFTPGLMDILQENMQPGQPMGSLSAALQILARRERYVAAVLPGCRYDIGAQYGLLQAQLSMSLRGPDRDAVLSMMLELLAR